MADTWQIKSIVGTTVTITCSIDGKDQVFTGMPVDVRRKLLDYFNAYTRSYTAEVRQASQVVTVDPQVSALVGVAQAVS